MKPIKHIFSGLLVCLCISGLNSCAFKPVPENKVSAKSVESAREAAAAFAADERLQPFFDEAIAYAVYPMAFRAGTGFGGAYGSGWLFRTGSNNAVELPEGKTVMWQLFAGPNLGFQFDRQILFFKTEDALKRFQKGTFEFAGQANAAAIVWGAAATPSFNSEVALFTQIHGGLLLEASVGAHRYDFAPIIRDNAPQTE